MVVSDGIPDVRGGDDQIGHARLLSADRPQPLDYLSKNVTVRLVYASPKSATTGESW